MNSRWINSISRAAGFAAVAGAALTLLACTTMGTGTGSLSPGNTPVAFNWSSKDGGITGTMSATIGGGAAFSGPFLQVTRYSGKVIANLKGPGTQQLRCRFQLNDPAGGMGGGGQGECQFGGGRTVDATFARS
jgi:hypothetical protein